MTSGKYGPHDPDADIETFNEPRGEFGPVDVKTFAINEARFCADYVERGHRNRFGIAYDFPYKAFREELESLIRVACEDVLERNGYDLGDLK